MPEPNCVEMLLDEIDRALKAELYVVATMAALTLPDMCAALETEGFWAKNVNYVAWCEKNLPQEFFSLATPELMKQLRNDLLHTGTVDDRKGNKKLILTIPDGRIHLSNNVCNETYLTDVVDFCHGLMRAARVWLAKNQNAPTVQRNLEKMIRRRENKNGIPPFIGGIPIPAIY